VSQGLPETWKIEPSTGFIEIFDVKKRQSVYSGKAAQIVISAMKGGKMKVAVDERKSLYYFSNELLFSAVGRAPINLKVLAGGKKSYSYRGTLAISPQKGGLRGVNIVDIEDYLKSVVPSEIYNRAPDAAQQAQTIAARTYAVRNLKRHSGSENFQLCDKVHCQVYSGIAREIKVATNAVKATNGKILIYGSEPANTVYHSNCGGYIIDSRAAWKGSEVPYLIGHYDGVVGQKPFCHFGKQIKLNQNTDKLPKPQASITIAKMQAQATKSTHKNFGHRVGMCQDGAIGMAAIGYNSRQLLAFYYPGTKMATMNYAVDGSQPVEEAPVVVAAAPRPTQTVSLVAPPNPTQISALQRNSKTGQSGRSIKDTLKQVSTSRIDSAATSLRKIFWTPGQPGISRSIY
jgi:stage II sporulation protein D